MKKNKNNVSSLFGILFVVMLSSFSQSLFSMNDNRWIPLLQQPYIRNPSSKTYLAVSPFFAYSGKGARSKNDDDISLLDLEIKDCGFDLGQLGKAFEIAKGCNPITEYNPAWKGLEIGWISNGKIQAQGIDFAGEHKFAKWFSIGFYTLFMRVNSTLEFIRNLDPQKDGICSNATEEDKVALDRIRREMFNDLCLSCGHSSQFGFGDIDLYFRFGWDWDYTCKFRHIDIGLRIGALLGTGQTRQINDPLSIPFGGNGHYGIYASLVGEFEVKEDFFVGFWSIVSKRFGRTYKERMPVCHESVPFGVVIGQVRVDPGVTFIFSPYVTAENMRDGLGFRLRYTLTHHQKDSWKDKRSTAEKECVKVNLTQVEDFSVWGTDYVSLSAFYDFGKVKVCRSYDPILSITWDVPTQWVVTKNSAQTQKLTIGFEFNF